MCLIMEKTFNYATLSYFEKSYYATLIYGVA